MYILCVTHPWQKELFCLANSIWPIATCISHTYNVNAQLQRGSLIQNMFIYITLHLVRTFKPGTAKAVDGIHISFLFLDAFEYYNFIFQNVFLISFIMILCYAQTHWEGCMIYRSIWWLPDMELLPALLAPCEGNPSVNSLHKSPVMRSFVPLLAAWTDFQQTADLTVLWKAMTLMWRHCDEICVFDIHLTSPAPQSLWVEHSWAPKWGIPRRAAWILGLCSLSSKTSYHQISRLLVVAGLAVIMLLPL